MKNSLNLVIAIALLVVLGCSCPAKLKELAAKKGSTPSPTPYVISSGDNGAHPPPPATSKKGAYNLTLDQYKQISIGMSRGDVERLLGGKGEEISDSMGGGMRFTVSKWEGEDYKSIILSFKNDRVMTMSQVGLK
jgi:hypothetical protein